ncbi:peptide ABC transporter [Skermanella aerolata]|uniref:Peptide ABC transporter n=1 Tax=Skermanella aerolata TaxID=393310 RepID=A0A512DPE4_9PROT|nr:ABC transporter permease [Skermanella aerolata]KJB95673.1 peptide ABC transporter [Skermanella aerolata KACC 11604]GEO38353.1 peptide ABC transporter [Skermanella aerolata]
MEWFVKRLGISVLLVWLVATIVFLAIYLVPGDPAELLLSQGGAAPDPAIVEDLRDQLGLNRPVLEQYLHSMAGLLRGDLGYSMMDGAPIAGEIATRLPRTLELIGAAALISVLVGVSTGTLAAVGAGGAFDRIASALAGLGLAVPVFVVGTVAILVFAQSLRLVPAGGFVPFSQDPAQHLILLLMPAGTIAVGLSATMFRVTRSAVLEVTLRDYVRTARAKGLSFRRILTRHILRNALIPVVTVLALNLGTLLGGTVLVEYVFNWPGLSGLLVDAVNGRDYPAVVGVVLVISILFVTLNFVVDVLYAVLDPRVRHG